MFSEATLVGRIGNDIELKRVGQNNTSLVSFNIAVSPKKNETHWFRVKAFGKWADVVSQYYKKGDLILLKATPATYSYKAKDGRDISGVEFIGSYFHNLAGKKAVETTTSDVKEDVPVFGEDVGSAITNEDIPF